MRMLPKLFVSSAYKEVIGFQFLYDIFYILNASSGVPLLSAFLREQMCVLFYLTQNIFVLAIIYIIYVVNKLTKR